MKKPILGILGGLGPLASAEFLRTLYRHHIYASEQEMPRCLLISDPTFPDRTQALLEGKTEELCLRLTSALSTLLEMGADILLIACVTAHGLLDQLEPDLRSRIISLVDLAIAEQAERPQRRLLLTTSGTRAARIFERNIRWPAVASSLIFLGNEDQAELHERLYRLKLGEAHEASGDWLRSLANRYSADGFVFGCTELHLLNSLFTPSELIDPLLIAVRELHKGW